MKNAVIFGLAGDNAKTAICRLEKDRLITIKAWLNATKDMEVVTRTYEELLSPNALKENYELCDPAVYEKVYKNIYVFLDMVFRNGEKPLYEYINIFNMWVNYYYTLFKKNEIEIVVFSDNPHFGVDSVAKDVADAMGIKTVLFMQNISTHRFWAFTDRQDIGVFDTLKNNLNKNVIIENKFEKNLFYMKELGKQKKYRIQYQEIYCKMKTWGSRLNKLVRADLNESILKIYNKICLNLITLYRKKIYELNLKRHFNASVNFNEKYIYFPLHLQPEMTTSSLGGMYCDQLLAIERLNQMIPKNWKIYVKENPKQKYYMRDEEFFKRVLLIPNIVLLNKSCNTYDLIKNSEFVATIAGTAGWEAISGGKCVLVFGLAWYRKLPGVFEYDKTCSVNEIISYKIKHEDLEKSYNDLINKAYTGVLECGYEVEIEGYTHETNNDFLYQAFKSILEKF